MKREERPTSGMVCDKEAAAARVTVQPVEIHVLCSWSTRGAAFSIRPKSRYTFPLFFSGRISRVCCFRIWPNTRTLQATDLGKSMVGAVSALWICRFGMAPVGGALENSMSILCIRIDILLL